MKQFFVWVAHKLGLASIAFAIAELIARGVERILNWFKALEVKYDQNTNKFVVQEAR